MLATIRRPALVLLALILPAAALAGEPVRLRVLTYNINHGEGTDGRVKLRRIADVIAAAEPDVVALQEVDRGTARTGRVDQADVLGRMTGMEHAFGRSLYFLGGEYGNALLSRRPIAGSETVELPTGTRGEPSGALLVRIRLDDGEEILIVSTQLDDRADADDRRAAADRINAAIGDGPAVLAGDLGVPVSDPPFDRLATAWASTAADPLPTVPAGRPTAQVDHVLVAPPGRWRLVEARVLDAPDASDHRPVLAVLEYVDPDRAGGK